MIAEFRNSFIPSQTRDTLVSMSDLEIDMTIVKRMNRTPTTIEIDKIVSG